jgi:ribosomal protein S18 acetylase RimI-like enzyme
MYLAIRKAQTVDAEALAEILTQAMRYKLDHDDMAWGSEPYTVQELYERITRGNTYTAWLHDTVVATLLLLWEDEMMWGKQPPMAAYVHQLAVKDGYHNHGIGGQLLDWASQQAAAKGRKLLRIDVPPSNSGLKTYYEKHGFQWVKNREIHAPHATYTAALYERPTGFGVAGFKLGFSGHIPLQ